MPTRDPIKSRWNTDARLDPDDPIMMTSQAFKALYGRAAAPDPDEEKKRKQLLEYGAAVMDLGMRGADGPGGSGW